MFAQPSPEITLNTASQLYVIHHDCGCSTFGFTSARDHTNQIAQRIQRPQLAFTDDDFGTLNGYNKYQAAVDAWACSPFAQQTYFDPGTNPKAARTLDRCRRANIKVRLILGNQETGNSWLGERDVVGTIGRSMGPLKVPLLVEPGADSGMAILTDCLLAIIEWETGTFLYRHPRWHMPTLSIQRGVHPEYIWEVLHNGGVVARFKDIGKAGAYVAFMCGETIEPRILQS
jgi:hypothetical protein